MLEGLIPCEYVFNEGGGEGVIRFNAVCSSRESRGNGKRYELSVDRDLIYVFNVKEQIVPIPPNDLEGNGFLKVRILEEDASSQKKKIEVAVSGNKGRAWYLIEDIYFIEEGVKQ